VSPAGSNAQKPPKPWSRAEAGRHVSSDERFTLASDGAGRWFVTDAESLDELGLARTLGPFSTLDAAKAAADEAREAPATASPLAERLAAAGSRPAGSTGSRPTRPSRARRSRPGEDRAEAGGASDPEPEPGAEPEPRTWLDELADRDADLAKRATRLVAALEREGIADADALVRRDILGDRPAIATRLLARDVLTAIAGLEDPGVADLAVAVAGVLAASPKRGGLPGWELRERDAPTGRDRSIRLDAGDLEDAAST
jgi:hypothetical protein